MKITLAKNFKESLDKLLTAQFEYDNAKNDLQRHYQEVFMFNLFNEPEFTNLFNKISAGANADILEDDNYDDYKRKLISKYLNPNIDVSLYLNPKYNLELIEKICQILNCHALDIKDREQMINLLVMEN